MDTLRADFALARRRFDVEVDLDVGREVLALAGPSGGGKTSVLRAIVGLDRPKRGRIAFGDTVWFDHGAGVEVPPERRRAAMVFQDYALFPHLTVEQNLAFGGAGRVDELLTRLRLRDLRAVRPGELSGGERQRVALGRALASDPHVLLLDEPMASLDPARRGEVRAELRDFLDEVAIPTLLVTHDFEDAAALASTIGVLVEGRLRQRGTPADLVAAPADPFVASLTGANLLSGRARAGDSDLTEVLLDEGNTVFSTDRVDGEVGVIVYPWDVAIGRTLPDDSTLNHISAPITSIVVLGNRARVRLGPIVAEITAASAARLELSEGQRAVASFKATATRLTRRAVPHG